MIKILKTGTRKEAECPSCGALLSYDEATDVQESTLPSRELLLDTKDCSLPEPIRGKEYYIICPQCNNKIILSATR